MYRKALSSFITPVETFDARISAVAICSDIGPVLRLYANRLWQL